MKTIWGRRMLVAALVLGAHACGGMRSGRTGTDGAAATVVVENNSGQQMDLFVVSDGGSRTRVGTIEVVGTTTVTIPRTYFAVGRLNLLAVPFAGSGAARAGGLQVLAGDTVVFVIHSNLDLSRAYVR